MKDHEDLITRTFEKLDVKITLYFIQTLVDQKVIDLNILNVIQHHIKDEISYSVLENKLPVSQINRSNDAKIISENIRAGSVFIHFDQEEEGILVHLCKNVERSIASSENESLIFGPNLAFTDSLETNIHLIQRKVRDENLCFEKLMIGERNHTEVRLVYLKDLTDESVVNTVRQRLEDLTVDDMVDSSVLAQYLDDNEFSLFPQTLLTELPDRVSFLLSKGKIAILADRSTNAIICPTSFSSFFETTDDVYTRWNIGTFLRMVRYIAMILSVLLTPAYVASLTYHYEIIPSALLVTLGQSRANVPFPPVFEALVLEFILELLREAGARLPTKVGQTMGIVGGIVIGQAAVEAGFTSNILIIIVALSALGTFTTPSYTMGAVIRIIRFPLIILAGLWGAIGIVVGIIYLMLHLLQLTSMGQPYMVPAYPFRFGDLKDSIVRIPYSYSNKRPVSNRPQDPDRYPAKEAKTKKDPSE
ncbi:spore gernimation protein [Bacillus coahuilensis m2-6]|uniref:Spore gernimation protein n=1 Tax=Bacillus coahuilensis p1.1.43 TaxID=1150625 RepID=A0A147KBY2_9BACI|nr:spore gernimation protein [Bacillus coahuilensis p1.1.43]KUP09900.1 spore gernimation protein [Bacillus coahuilensis m2-6]